MSDMNLNRLIQLLTGLALLAVTAQAYLAWNG